jgi:hypothetical protein
MATKLVAPLTGQSGQTPLHHFRLIFISYYDRSKMPLLLYEVVKGARIEIKTRPNSKVLVRVNASFANKQFVPWQDYGQADARGIFTTIAPYAITAKTAPFVIDSYQVSTDSGQSSLDVDEDSVVQGSTVRLSL